MLPKKKFARTTRQERKRNAEDEKGDETARAMKVARSNDEESQNVKQAGSRPQKKLIFGFAKKTTDLGAKGLKDQFGTMKRICDWENMKVFMDSNNKGKNRYKDVGCLDGSRVKLKNSENDYIHANYVKTPASDKRFICAQAPLEKTCADFWAMIMQECCENIIMLCNLTEKGAKKCHEYFPTNPDETLIFDNYTVRCISRQDFKFKCNTSAVIKETQLEVKCESKSQELKHYHWVDWPDRGVPHADMAIIELLKAICVTKTPIVVHCSAGIGRTGSVVLIEYILEMVQNGQVVDDCAVLLRELRNQRANSVQTDQQYLYVHMVLLNYWENLLGATFKPHLDKFTKQYKALVVEK